MTSIDSHSSTAMPDEITVTLETASRDYQRIEKAIHFLSTNVTEQPGLQEVAAELNLSEYHFQRLFKRWAGITPKQFLQFLSQEKAKQLLREERSVLETSHLLGLSAPSRLHDLFISVESITPGEYKTLGKGLVIEYGFAPSLFGECLVASCPRGICGLSFVENENHAILFTALQSKWPLSKLQENKSRSRELASQVFFSQEKPNLKIVINGTAFQLQVWQALMNLKAGEVVSYQQIAASIGKPNASRAVGSAIAKNSIAYLVPCHRVIKGLGLFGNYRWGSDRKKAMLLYEYFTVQGS